MATGEKGPLFVFEEVHTSRVGQLQIAVMLLRLREKYGLGRIGLEGAIQSKEPLDASWFQQAGGEQANQEREDLSVQMLADGEISSAECMAMLLPDFNVYGIESGDLYNQKLEVTTSPELRYLIAIAQKSLTVGDVQKLNSLVKDRKTRETLEYIMNADPWVSDQFKALMTTASIEASVARIREIQDRAREVKAQLDVDTVERWL